MYQIAEPWMHCNLVSFSKDKLTKRTFIKGNNTSILFLAQTLAPGQISILILGSLSIYINIDLQKAISLALKSFFKSQEHG